MSDFPLYNEAQLEQIARLLWTVENDAIDCPTPISLLHRELDEAVGVQYSHRTP